MSPLSATLDPWIKDIILGFGDGPRGRGLRRDAAVWSPQVKPREISSPSRSVMWRTSRFASRPSSASRSIWFTTRSVMPSSSNLRRVGASSRDSISSRVGGGDRCGGGVGRGCCCSVGRGEGRRRRRAPKAPAIAGTAAAIAVTSSITPGEPSCIRRNSSETPRASLREPGAELSGGTGPRAV